MSQAILSFTRRKQPWNTMLRNIWTIKNKNEVMFCLSTCWFRRLRSSCSSRVLRRDSSPSLFSQVACSWVRAPCRRSTFSTYALFLCSSVHSCWLRICVDLSVVSRASLLRWWFSASFCRCWTSCSRCAHWSCCSSSVREDRKKLRSVFVN